MLSSGGISPLAFRVASILVEIRMALFAQADRNLLFKETFCHCVVESSRANLLNWCDTKKTVALAR